MTQRPGPTPPRQFSSVATRERWCGAASSDYPTNTGASFCCAISKNLIPRRPRDLSRLRRTPSKCGSIGLGRHSRRSSSESLRSGHITTPAHQFVIATLHPGHVDSESEDKDDYAMRFNRFARFAAFALTIAFISASGAANAEENPRVRLHLQVAFSNYATALSITPEDTHD